MSISINNNYGIIEVSQDGSVLKSYFKTSGKFFPSGSVSGQATSITGVFPIISNDTSGCIDGLYTFQTQGATSGVGSGISFTVYINGGTIEYVGNNDTIIMQGTGSGYAIGDTITIYGSDYGGTGNCVILVNALGIDGFLINFDKDFYDVRYYDLIVQGSSSPDLTNTWSQLINLVTA